MAILPLLMPFAAQVAAPAPVTPGPHHRGLFISPTGEPFRPRGHDDDTLADWFRQADRNHDGRLTLDEMQQDAERFFATLDINHDGEIDPDEIARYENVIAPEISSGPRFAMTGMEGATANRAGGGNRRGHHRGGGGHSGGGSWGGGGRPGGEGSDRGAARFGLLDLPEPVASADADFNRGVSLKEFRDAAGQRFLALDLDHRGNLTLAGLEMILPAPPPEPNKPETNNEAEGDPATPSD